MKRVVLITGVSGGIGSATAKVFFEAEWHVVGIDFSEVKGLEWVHHFIRGDLTDEAVSARVFAEVADVEGRIDALINNAAIQICKPLVDTTPREWDRVMATNVRAVYLAVRHAYSLMRDQESAIVNVSSVHALATSANIAAYAASKGALLSMTRALAIELAPDKIRVNTVLPGAVDTPMLDAGLSQRNPKGENLDQLKKQIAIRHIVGRVGRPEEIAQAIFFLSDARMSSFVTGQTLVADGGALAKLSTE